MNQIIADENVLEVIRSMMLEGMQVSKHYGYPMPMTPDQRIDIARQLGAARISMLQDLEQRRPLELAAIVEAVIELAGWPGSRCRRSATCTRWRLPAPAPSASPDVRQRERRVERTSSSAASNSSDAGFASCSTTVKWLAPGIGTSRTKTSFHARPISAVWRWNSRFPARRPR